MLRDHLIGRKKRHRQSILAISLFVLFVLVTGVAVLYGMRYAGVGAIAIAFVVTGWVMDSVLE